MAHNPFAKPHKVLGQTDVDWNQLKATITAFLQQNDDRQEIPDKEIRALDPALKDDLLWNQLKAEMGLE